MSSFRNKYTLNLFYFRQHIKYGYLAVLTILVKLSIQAEDVVINSYPSNQFSEAEIIDVRNETGLYIRKLGHLALTEFEYKIILPLPIPKALEEIRP